MPRIINGIPAGEGAKSAKFPMQKHKKSHATSGSNSEASRKLAQSRGGSRSGLASVKGRIKYSPQG